MTNMHWITSKFPLNTAICNFDKKFAENQIISMFLIHKEDKPHKCTIWEYSYKMKNNLDLIFCKFFCQNMYKVFFTCMCSFMFLQIVHIPGSNSNWGNIFLSKCFRNHLVMEIEMLHSLFFEGPPVSVKSTPA